MCAHLIDDYLSLCLMALGKDEKSRERQMAWSVVGEILMLLSIKVEGPISNDVNGD